MHQLETTLNITLITHLALAIVTAGAVWVFQDARMDAAVAEVRLEQSNERIGAVTKARADELWATVFAK
jgi:hypothetical protein